VEGGGEEREKEGKQEAGRKEVGQLSLLSFLELKEGFGTHVVC